MKKNYLFAIAASASLTASAFTGKTLCNFFDYSAFFWPKGVPVTVEEYNKRTFDGYKNVKFDTLVVSSMVGFGSVAGFLKTADYPKHQPAGDSRWMRGYVNAMPTLEKLGADPIKLAVDWCRRNKKEIVIALPVNPRIHGQKPTPERGLASWHAYLWPAFKTQNPDALMSPDDKTPVIGRMRYDVDYGTAKVRDKFAAIAAEIAGKYDIDGLMVDFMMTPSLFRSVATGGTAEAKDLAALTAMMQKVAAACKGAASRLGHPVTFCARVPDSMGFCKDVGIDLQGWFDAKLLDAVVIGGSFSLSRWNATGDVARKAGVPCYASFTGSGIFVGNDSGYAGDDERLPRQGRQTFAARVADALDCKMAGCMYSQTLHWDPGWFGLDRIVPYDAASDARADKRYFVSYTNDREANEYLKDASKHRTLPSLLSGSPVSLAKGPATFKVCVWENAEILKETGPNAPKAVLVTEVLIPSGMETIVTFNGKAYSPFKKKAGTQWYEIPLSQVHRGANEVTVKSKGKNKRGETAKLGNIAMTLTYPKAAAKK